MRFMMASNATIPRSLTRAYPKPTRSVVVPVTSQTNPMPMQGKQQTVVLALDIMCDAVERYKELCEGQHSGALTVLMHTKKTR